ncbi:MAG: thioredoxin family protein [candidate division Zixibacteria bacterium]|nr:thioredoxin family protein [candidate division Zixibacteria bacterium]
MKIQILGTGCSKCSRAGQIIKETAANLGLVEGQDFNLEKITDIQEIMKYKVMLTPGIVINGKVVSTGKVPSTAEAQQFINNAQAKTMK